MNLLKAFPLLALLATPLGAQFRDLPPLSEPRILETTFEDGLWHHRFGEPRDNTGDGQLRIVIEGDAPVWILMMRMGTPPPGGAFWRKEGALDNPYEGWTGNQQQPPIKGLPGIPPHSHGNIDTHHNFQDPHTFEMNWFSGVKPGYRRQWAQLSGNPNWSTAAGVVFSIERSTSMVLAAEPENYTRDSPELWLTPHPDAPWEHPVYYRSNNSYWGGVAEGAIDVDTFNLPYAVGVGFYTSKTREDPDAFGQRHRSRIGRYAFFLEGPDAMKPVRLPAPGPESYVWDARRDGAGGKYGSTNESAVWGTANGILQQHVFINPYDGRYHLLVWGKKPNTGQGKVNRTVGLAHYWSENQGLNWIPDTGNPIFTKQSLGFEDIGVANQMNSPHGFIDTWNRKGYIFVWMNEIDRVNKVGTRLYGFEFAL